MNADMLDAIADLLRAVDTGASGFKLGGAADIWDAEGEALGWLQFNGDTETTFKALGSGS